MSRIPAASRSHPGLSSGRWLLLESGAGASAENMAWDEALLESVLALGTPILRFYGWREAAATFGYFQRFADVAGMTPLRPLIRRPTGGGLVLHDADWTYSLMMPPSHAWYQLKAVESYEAMHEWIRLAFERLGARTELTATAIAGRPGQCFAGAERFDVVQEGLKIAGAAQRRNRHGLLIQGSVRPGPGLAVGREAWQQAMLDRAVESWGARWQPLAPGPDLRSRVRDLTAARYEQASYNAKR